MISLKPWALDLFLTQYIMAAHSSKILALYILVFVIINSRLWGWTFLNYFILCWLQKVEVLIQDDYRLIIHIDIAEVFYAFLSKY